MMSIRSIYIAATVCLLVLQLAVIGSVIVKGNIVLSRGVECRFKATGYDPSDPLRGRYVRFDALVETKVFDEGLSERAWGKAYFQLSETPDASGFTQVLRCAEKPTSEGLWIGPVKMQIDYTLPYSEMREGESCEDFLKRREQSPQVARAELPEKYYVPEKLAPELEKRLSKQGASAVAVYRAYKGSILLTDLQVIDK